MRGKYNTTTEATCFVSEQVSKILVLDGKIRNSMLKNSLNRNGNFPLGYEPDMIMSSKSPFAQAFDKFAGKKKLDQYIMPRNVYVKPQEISIRFHSVKNKSDNIQYVSTLNAILQHEDILGELNSNCEIWQMDGKYFKENILFQSNPNVLQICLYHDDFNIVNPLGNTTEKYKVSTFYFVIENLSAKFKSRLKDIHLAVLSPAAFVSIYGYKPILAPLLDDIKKLETEGIQVMFKGNQRHFFGTLSMPIADNLAAHAIGGYFCNFSTVH